MRLNTYNLDLEVSMTALIAEGWDFDTAIYLMGITEEEGREALEKGE